MKTTALIEKGKDGSYGVFTPDLNSLIIGDGATVAEAIADFQNSMHSAEKFAPSEKDLEYAAELRELIHQKVLEKARMINPAIKAVDDPYPVEAYFQWSWEYPGAWYLVVAIPDGFKSRDAFINFLVKETLKITAEP
jgi:hypothetical protein